jgi:hypothetical protein
VIYVGTYLGNESFIKIQSMKSKNNKTINVVLRSKKYPLDLAPHVQGPEKGIKVYLCCLKKAVK